MRKLITLVLMGVSLIGGMKVQAFMNEGRCQNAGGVVDARGLCRGAPLE